MAYTKKAYEIDKLLMKSSYTQRDKDNIVEDYQSCISERDFTRFAAYCRVHSELTNDWLYLNEKRWTPSQKKFNKERNGRDIVLKPRRIGFTTLELARDLFFALTNPGSTTMIVAQDQKTANNCIEIIRNMIDNLVELSKKLDSSFSFVPAVKNSTKTSVSFAHKATIVCEVAKASEMRANSTGRGFSISRLHATEVAFWTFPDVTIKSLLTAASKALEIVIESTANGANGWFYEKYFEAKDKRMSGYRSHFFPWYEHTDYKRPFISQYEIDQFDATPKNEYEVALKEEYLIDDEQLRWFRDKVSETNLHTVIQEYPMDEETCFQSLRGVTFITPEEIERIQREICEPKETMRLSRSQMPLKIWLESKPGEEYVLGSDTSYGRGQDYGTAVVCEKISGQIAATFRDDSIDPISFAHVLVEIGNYYNTAFMTIELQGPGIAVVGQVLQLNYFNLFQHDNKSYYGFNTSPTTRMELTNLLQKLVSDAEIRFVDHDLLSEIRTLVIKENNRVEHANNCHDDLVFGFMLAQYGRGRSRALMSTGYQSIKRNNSSLGYSRFGRRRFQ